MSAAIDETPAPVAIRVVQGATLTLALELVDENGVAVEFGDSTLSAGVVSAAGGPVLAAFASAVSGNTATLTLETAGLRARRDYVYAVYLVQVEGRRCIMRGPLVVEVGAP